ncbi:hypothetical protein QEH56_10235 [Pelagicoccus enzymogenes]|uniref:hypothetical protein n=1 Tax=Pelagicoccus enzymogenes TaxID=2773457 RepID=UPI00280E57B6|nr:hypothetical protein [Pelagicoccus enzymogenes]MDQ8198528.1 hypothetical protein [Pelagicoccus enzymogenes]
MICSEIVQQYESRFGRIDVYDRYLVSTLNSEAGRDPNRLEYLHWILAITEEHFCQPWGFIGNRVNANAADPALLARARKTVPLWRSFAVVGYTSRTRELFELESLVLNGFPHCYFEALECAEAWTDTVIRSVRSQ